MKPVSSAILRTPHGDFSIYVFRDFHGANHLALTKGEGYFSNEPVIARVHSSCKTGEVFLSLGCDCRQQLDAAMEKIGKSKAGIVVYLEQEGRGIGIEKKISAYSLQQKGYDTVQANEALGLPPDAREYKIAVEILNFFDIGKVRLMTNNPEKIKSLEKNGIEVSERIPLIIEPNRYTRRYLSTKKKKLGHMLE